MVTSKLDTLEKTIDISGDALREVENVKHFTQEPMIRKFQQAMVHMDFTQWKNRAERRTFRGTGDVRLMGSGGTLAYRGGIKNDVKIEVEAVEDRGNLSDTLSDKEDTTRRNEEHSIW